MYAQMGKYYRRLELFGLTEVARAEHAEQQSWLRRGMHALAGLRASRAALNLTDEVIPRAIDYVFPDQARREDGGLSGPS